MIQCECTRRSVIVGLTCSISSRVCAFPSSDHLQLSPSKQYSPTGVKHAGCTFAPGDIGQTLGKRMLLDPSRGIAKTGRLISGPERLALRQIMGVDASIDFYDDQTPNAVALPKEETQTNSGTILIGALMMQRVPEVFDHSALIGVVAHEAAHLLQYYLEPQWVAGGPQVELHADFMAGWYLGVKQQRYNLRQINPDAFSNLLQLLGDCDFTSKSHHGTPDERTAAMEAGYRLVLDNKFLTSLEAFKAGRTKLGI